MWDWQRQKVLSIEDDVVRLVVTEGRNRVVRRMLHNAGHSVLDLQRVRYGTVALGDLEIGQTQIGPTMRWRYFQHKKDWQSKPVTIR